MRNFRHTFSAQNRHYNLSMFKPYPHTRSYEIQECMLCSRERNAWKSGIKSQISGKLFSPGFGPEIEKMLCRMSSHTASRTAVGRGVCATFRLHFHRTLHSVAERNSLARISHIYRDIAICRNEQALNFRTKNLHTFVRWPSVIHCLSSLKFTSIIIRIFSICTSSNVYFVCLYNAWQKFWANIEHALDERGRCTLQKWMTDARMICMLIFPYLFCCWHFFTSCPSPPPLAILCCLLYQWRRFVMVSTSGPRCTILTL